MKSQPERLSLLPEDFVDMVAHEMRTPLTSIRASLGLIAAGVHGETNPEQRQALEIAVSNLERMGRLLDDLLDMTKIRVGRLELRRDLVNWATLAKEVAQTFKPLAQQRRLELRLETPRENVESYVDRDKIVQIFCNLVHNAMKFTARGQVSIAVIAHPGRIECSVSDTGPGISPEGLSRLFSMFTQFGQKSHTGERGSGLGLSLARQLVELHGGTIRAENLPQQGARFVFFIPRVGSQELFEKEAERLLRLASRHEKPLSLAQFTFRNWPSLESQMGAAGAAGLMSHFETLIRSSLRGKSDFVLQSPGTFWLAAYSVNKNDGLGILNRIHETFTTNPPSQALPEPLDMVSRLANFPQDGTATPQLLAQLKAPSN